jgi:RNA polymerase-binding transcription factor DksA
MSHLSAAEIDALTRRLRDIRARALHEMQDGEVRQDTPGTDREPRDRADEAEPLRQEEVRWAEMEIDRHTVADVDRAMARLAVGEYGVCVDCQGAIPQARLFAQPTAIRCAACQAVAEATRRN